MNSLPNRQPWVADALCAQIDVGDIFFPERQGQSCEPAKKICRMCPVIGDCLEHAILNNESGVWGGTSEAERRNIRRARGIRLPNDRRSIEHGTEAGSRAHARRGERACLACREAANYASRERNRRRQATA